MSIHISPASSQTPPFVYFDKSGLEHSARIIEDQSNRLRARLPSSPPIEATSSHKINTAPPVDEDVVRISRETTPIEEITGEIRNWVLINSNWDGEGATPPSRASIHDSVAFARLLTESQQLPEPMLLPTGNISLFWNVANLYADLEFLGQNRIAYFVKKDGVKHKGVAEFDKETLPNLFADLLRT